MQYAVAHYLEQDRVLNGDAEADDTKPWRQEPDKHSCFTCRPCTPCCVRITRECRGMKGISAGTDVRDCSLQEENLLAVRDTITDVGGVEPIRC